MSRVLSADEMHLRLAECGHALKLQLQDLCQLELLVPQTGTLEVIELVAGLDAELKVSEVIVSEVMTSEVMMKAMVKSGLHCASAYESGSRRLTCLAKAMNEIYEKARATMYDVALDDLRMESC